MITPLHLDRLSRPGISVPRRNRRAPSLPGRAGVEGPPQSERVSQGAPRRRLWHIWTRRLGQLVCVVFYQTLVTLSVQSTK